MSIFERTQLSENIAIGVSNQSSGILSGTDGEGGMQSHLSPRDNLESFSRFDYVECQLNLVAACSNPGGQIICDVFIPTFV